MSKITPFVALSDEQAREAQQVLADCNGSQTEAAKRLGIARSTFQNRLARAAERGLADRTGSVPDGFVIKGKSTLYDAEGQVTAEWVKTTRDVALGDVQRALEDAFQSYKGFALKRTAPEIVNGSLLTVYPLSDHHLGLYAWASEAGADYDLNIAGQMLTDAMQELVDRSPPAHTALVLGLGDFFHSDSDENRTRRSGNALDVDTRYAKVLKLGVELVMQCVELALQKHAHVVLRMLPGNHDPYAALALSIALGAFFDANPRVTVDMDPSYFYHYRFGQVLIAATHGDMVKPVDFPGVMASYWPEDWGLSKYRYAYLGHVHSRNVGGGERQGVVWETFQTLAAKDAWHFQSGYVSRRSMTAITHHEARGEVERHTVVPDIGGK